MATRTVIDSDIDMDRHKQGRRQGHSRDTGGGPPDGPRRDATRDMSRSTAGTPGETPPTAGTPAGLYTPVGTPPGGHGELQAGARAGPLLGYRGQPGHPAETAGARHGGVAGHGSGTSRMTRAQLGAHVMHGTNTEHVFPVGWIHEGLSPPTSDGPGRGGRFSGL